MLETEVKEMESNFNFIRVGVDSIAALRGTGLADSFIVVINNRYDKISNMEE